MRLKLGPLLLLLCWVTGCVIGTWPTPEDTTEATPDVEAIGAEACNDVDDDGDGTVDEGCRCDEEARGCVGVVDGVCGFGVQYCDEGYWGHCTNIGPPYNDARPPTLTVVSASPATVTRGDTTAITVQVRVRPMCPAIQIDDVDIVLEAASPVMRLRATARDDGIRPDSEALDGEHSAELVNPFGPGVPAQILTIRASAVLSGQTIEAERTLELVDP